MLASGHDGERAAAALKASDWLREHGLTWADVTVPGVGAAPYSFAEVSEAEMARQREGAVRASREFREAVRKANRAKWAGQARQPDANGFYDDLREDIRRATGGKDGVRDPRVRK